MSKIRFECRQVILKYWTQMTPKSETLTYTTITIKQPVFYDVI